MKYKKIYKINKKDIVLYCIILYFFSQFVIYMSLETKDQTCLFMKRIFYEKKQCQSIVNEGKTYAILLILFLLLFPCAFRILFICYYSSFYHLSLRHIFFFTHTVSVSANLRINRENLTLQICKSLRRWRVKLTPRFLSGVSFKRTSVSFCFCQLSEKYTFK